WLTGLGEEVHDGAAALLLVPAALAHSGSGQVAAVSCTFCAGHPEVALRHAVEQVLSGQGPVALALCDPETERVARVALSDESRAPLRVDEAVYPAGCG